MLILVRNITITTPLIKPPLNNCHNVQVLCTTVWALIFLNIE